MILIIPLTNIEQGKTILNKEQGIMNKEVVQGQSAYFHKGSVFILQNLTFLVPYSMSSVFIWMCCSFGRFLYF